MYKVLVFAGTTEGYEICRFLADHKIETKGFVATEYGSKSLTESEFLTVQTGRLDAAAMEETFLQEKPEMVLVPKYVSFCPLNNPAGFLL